MLFALAISLQPKITGLYRIPENARHAHARETGDVWVSRSFRLGLYLRCRERDGYCAGFSDDDVFCGEIDSMGDMIWTRSLYNVYRLCYEI